MYAFPGSPMVMSQAPALDSAAETTSSEPHGPKLTGSSSSEINLDTVSKVDIYQVDIYQATKQQMSISAGLNRTTKHFNMFLKKKSTFWKTIS
jgi:hypothetical protein